MTPAMSGAAADPSASQKPSAGAPDEDVRINPAEPDFTLISLPTPLRVPRYKSAFRVTHRFAQPLNANAGDVASNLFGLDSWAPDRARVSVRHRTKRRDRHPSHER
jgi:hypothetical protein